MIESPIIAELLAEHELKVAVKVRAEAKAESLLRVLRKRHGELPEELSTAIRTCTDGEQLDRWLDAAGEGQTLAEFRQQTGL